METLDLLILLGITLSILLVASRLSRWLLQFLNCHDLLEKDEFFRRYEIFTNESALKRPDGSLNKSSDEYEDYMKFHRKKRERAYSCCKKYLYMRLAPVLIISLAFLITPSYWDRLH